MPDSEKKPAHNFILSYQKEKGERSGRKTGIPFHHDQFNHIDFIFVVLRVSISHRQDLINSVVCYHQHDLESTLSFGSAFRFFCTYKSVFKCNEIQLIHQSHNTFHDARYPVQLVVFAGFLELVRAPTKTSLYFC